MGAWTAITFATTTRCFTTASACSAIALPLSHLTRHGVGPGDVLLFFGMFDAPDTGERHHRIFGYCRVQTATPLNSLTDAEREDLLALRHPHVLDRRVTSDVIYCGEGEAAKQAHKSLRMTRPGGPLSQSIVPNWLEAKGLGYPAMPWRWAEPGALHLVSRGQEFVCDIGDDPEAIAWIEDKIAAIRA